VINTLSVEISNISAAGQVLELLDGSYADDFFTVIRDPDGDGVSPVSVPGEAPILGINKPVVEASLLNEGGHPLTLSVVFDQLVLDVSYLNKPGVEGSIDQGSLRSPAIGVTMDDGAS